jgi:hypothetical protein
VEVRCCPAAVIADEIRKHVTGAMLREDAEIRTKREPEDLSGISVPINLRGQGADESPRPCRSSAGGFFILVQLNGPTSGS